jgi:competence protein ComGC
MINMGGELEFQLFFAIIIRGNIQEKEKTMKRRNHGFTLIELLIVIMIMSILFALMMPNFMRARASGLLTSCQSNLKNMATSIEQYATDNAGRYPSVINDLLPNYIHALPDCPSCKFGYDYIYRTVPDAYTVYCKTANAHGVMGVPDGFPQYDSANGLYFQ